LVVCVVRGEGGPFYSPRRSVPARIKYGNTRHRLQEEKDDHLIKARAIWHEHGAGRPRGLASSQVPPLALPFVLDTARWAPILCMSVPGLCMSVFSVKCALLVNVTQDWIFYASVLRLVYVFILFHIWVPANHNSPKLVELISYKPYN
jgi:hypothetical protein